MALIPAIPRYGQTPMVRQVPEGPLTVRTVDAVTGRPLAWSLVCQPFKRKAPNAELSECGIESRTPGPTPPRACCPAPRLH
jgi:hypothetical protein